MAVTTALNVAAIMLWNPILPLILRDLGASDFQISLSVSLWTAAGALSQYQGGIWSDRLGRYPTMVYPTYLCAVSVAVAAVMTSWQPFVLAYVFWYVANSLQTPTYAAIIGEAVPPERRGQAFGMVESCIMLGVIAGPLVGAGLLPAVGARGLLLMTGAVFCGTGLLRQLLLRETKPPAAGAVHFRFTQVFTGRLAVVLIVSTAFNLMASTTLWGPFLALHASDAMGLSKAGINLLFAAGSVVAAVASLLAGRAVPRWGCHRVMAWGTLALGAAALLWALQRHMAGITAGMLLMAAAFQFVMVAVDTFRVVALPDSTRGRALGATGTVSSLAATLALPLAGYLRLAFPLAPFLMAAGTAVVMFLAVQRIKGEDTGHQ